MSNYSNIKKYCLNRPLYPCTNGILNSKFAQDFTIVEAWDNVKFQANILDLIASYDLKQAKKTYNALLSVVEIAKTCSHFNIYKEISENNEINDNDFVLVSDHNVELDKDFDLKLNQLLGFLSQKKYNSSELVLFSYFKYVDNVNFIPGFLKYKKIENNYKLDVPIEGFYEDQRNVYNPDDPNNKSVYCCKPEVLKDYYHYLVVQDRNCDIIEKQGISKENIKYLCKTNMEKFIGTSPKLVKQFTYDYNDAQQIQYVFPLNFLRPCNSNNLCYLIRKKTCKNIISKFKKPYWYADDFKQFISIQNILMVSPFLCKACNETDPNQVVDAYGSINRYYRKTEKLNDNYKFSVLRHLPVLQSLQYSNSSFIRGLGKFIESIVLL